MNIPYFPYLSLMLATHLRLFRQICWSQIIMLFSKANLHLTTEEHFRPVSFFLESVGHSEFIDARSLNETTSSLKIKSANFDKKWVETQAFKKKKVIRKMYGFIWTDERWKAFSYVTRNNSIWCYIFMICVISGSRWLLNASLKDLVVH